MMVATSVATYRDYYRDEGKDPYGGEYTDLMSVYRSENQPPTNADLLALTGNADNAYASAFLALNQTSTGSARLRVVQGLSRYPTLVGRQTPWDGRLFAFSGDVVEGMITTVEFPQDAFNMTAYTNVPRTLERARDLLEQNPDEDYLGPFGDDDANVKQVHCRNLVPLPHKYVSLLLGRDVSAREGLIDLGALIEANNDGDACEELTNWLLAAVTRTVAGAFPLVTSTPPSVPLADEALHRHRKGVLLRHLPGLSTAHNPSPLEATQQRLATSVGEMVTEQRRAREEAQNRAVQDRAPKSVAKALGSETTSTLLAICQVTNEADLPKFWRDVAEAGKRDRQALEQALLGKARDIQMAEVAPVATPDLIKKVVGLQWAGLSVDDLAEGIQPFAIVLQDYVGSDAGVEAQRLAEAYDVMMGAETTSTLQDAQTVKGTKAVIPKDFSEARAHLVALMVLWTVLLGDDHPMVLAYGTFLKLYSAREYSFQNKLRALGTAAPAAALLLRFIQLRMTNYWRKALSYRLLPATPNFEEVLDKLEMQDTSWIPTLPLKYWKPLTNPGSDLRSVISGVTLGTAAPPSGASTAPSTNTQTSSANGGSTTANSRNQTAARNPGVSAVFEPYAEKIRSTNIKTAIARGGQPPTVERDGRQVPMCVSYHLKGLCWSGCARSADHATHSEEEETKLLHWCQAAYA